MSEAITKECETCGGWLRHYRGCEDRDRPFVHPDTQPDASTGRVPDVEATLRAELDAARAEVARLTEEVARKDAAFDAHVAVTNQISANAIRVADENDRLTAEVERLKGRDKTAYVWVRAAEFAAPTDTSAWGACPECGRTRKQGHVENCPIAAWLAGCKS